LNLHLMPSETLPRPGRPPSRATAPIVAPSQAGAATRHMAVQAASAWARPTLDSHHIRGPLQQIRDGSRVRVPASRRLSGPLSG
jgi:hypothetical protein